jgi:hypothetical protein
LQLSNGGIGSKLIKVLINQALCAPTPSLTNYSQFPEVSFSNNFQEETMMNKLTRLIALSGALLWSGVAMAQSPSPSGSPTGSPSSPEGGATTTTTTTTTEALLPADGAGMETGDVTVTTDTLPATGGAPLLMALTGALAVGGALLGLKKVR